MPKRNLWRAGVRGGDTPLQTTRTDIDQSALLLTKRKHVYDMRC